MREQPLRRKLIEVALPLEAISAASRRDKNRKTGTIKNVHKWFAPMPSPAWRALLFASLVTDPTDDTERAALLRITERLVPADGSIPNDETLKAAQGIIEKEWPDGPPIVLDPFCGGGSTLVEAQRLDLKDAGSDLNPVPVLVSRVLSELIPKVAGHPALHPAEGRLSRTGGHPLDNLLTDIDVYAQRVRDHAWSRVSSLYPADVGGGVVAAWIWTRTVRCPNPACEFPTPLVSSFWLSKRRSDPTWIEVSANHAEHVVAFKLRSGSAGPRDKTIGRGGARCVVCDTAIPLDYLRTEGKAGRLSKRLMAMAVQRDGKRMYVGATDEHEVAGSVSTPESLPDLPLPPQALGFRVQGYGLTRYTDLFATRQLHALAAFADAVSHVTKWVTADGGSNDYARAIASVLGLCVGKLAQSNSTQVRWYIDARNGAGQPLPAFGRNALPMVWDFAEANPFGGSVGDWLGQIASVSLGLRSLPAVARPSVVSQVDAREASEVVASPALVATDPPYFAQIGYADLSDYFYLWLRPALRSVHPDIFSTLATPKSAELIAAPGRHDGDAEKARSYFVDGFTSTFRSLAKLLPPEVPMLIVYGHRQEEATEDGRTSTAWDSMLAAIMAAGLCISGTWPIHGTHSSRQRSQSSNALASYIVLVCRPRPASAPTTDRRGFIDALQAELPDALRELQQGRIAPVDLSQAAIGPGMSVFSRYASVLEADGSPMSIRSALDRINEILDQVLNEQEGAFDPTTRFAIAWYRQHGYGTGKYGDANTLANARNTSVDVMTRAGIVRSAAGNVTLLSPGDVADDYDPIADDSISAWEVLIHMVAALRQQGIVDAARILSAAEARAEDPVDAEAVKELAFLLFSIAERSGWPQDALAFNELATAWTDIVEASRSAASQVEQSSFDLGNE